MRLLIILIFSLLYNCQSAQVADTVRIQERSNTITTNLDNAANECLTEDCRKAMREAKLLIKDSLDIMINKDTTIRQKQKEIDSSSLYTSIGRYVVWGAITIFILFLLYIFRDTIFSLLKIAKPI